MRTTTLALAATLALSLTGAAMAQSTMAPGSATGNMNNPGSVKSNGEKGMPESTGTAGSRMAPGADSKMAPGADSKMAPASESKMTPGNGTMAPTQPMAPAR